MPFALDDFVAKRPYLYHLTARANLPYLRAERRLHSTTALLHAAGLEPLNRTKRKEMRSIAIGEHTVILRDQAPLYEGHVALADGWIFDDLLADLNRRVYFWPDDTDAPIDYGRRHFARYATPPTCRSPRAARPRTSRRASSPSASSTRSASVWARPPRAATPTMGTSCASWRPGTAWRRNSPSTTTTRPTRRAPARSTTWKRPRSTAPTGTSSRAVSSNPTPREAAHRAASRSGKEASWTP